jgi:hypothetical protein
LILSDQSPSTWRSWLAIGSGFGHCITDAIGSERRANETQRGLPLEIGIDVDPLPDHFSWRGSNSLLVD